MDAQLPELGYHAMARSYDVFFVKHREILKQIREEFLHDVLPSVRAACDLGCGTGYTAIDLARRGLKVFATDVSSTMCQLARENSQKAAVPIHVLQCDMRSVELPEHVDLVLAEYDVVNHLPQKSDLEAVARSVSGALVQGGHFYFDVNTKKVFETMWPQVHFLERQGMVFIPHGGYDPVEEKGWLAADYFLPEGDRWRRVTERLEQVWWEPQEILNTFGEAGFTLVRTADLTELKAGMESGVQPGCTTFYLFQKAGPEQT